MRCVCQLGGGFFSLHHKVIRLLVEFIENVNVMQTQCYIMLLCDFEYSNVVQLTTNTQ